MWRKFLKDPGGVLLDEGLRGIARLTAMHPAAKPSRYGVTVTQNVAFGAEPWQRLDIYAPKQARGIPLLYLHGGGFRILSKETHWAMALSFARRGYTVFVSSYRLAPKHPFPAGLEDAAEALLWLHAHAKDYGLDANELVVAGESAGANLTVALAIATCWSRPEPYCQAIFQRGIALRAILPACGMLQVSDPDHRGTPRGFLRDRIVVIERDYLPPGRGPEITTSQAALADVVSYLESAPQPARPLPPSLAIYGGKDPIRKDSERLTPAWTRLGGHAEHELYPGQGHAFHAFVWTKSARAAWRRQHDFLDSVFGSAMKVVAAEA